MPRTIKLILEYDGTDFNGWQTQTARRANQKQNTSEINKRTVQNELEEALQTIFNKKPKVVGSGRTDSGVHAWGQVAHFKTTSSMPLTEMRNAINANLPDDVAIIDIAKAAENFHAQYDAKSKIYRYTILNRSNRTPLGRNYHLFYPYTLNLRSMREEAKSLIGRKDFKSFTATDPSKTPRSTIRTVKCVNIMKRGDLILIDIEANGFLYKMVRNIVGTLLAVGSGTKSKGSIKDILAQKDRNAAGPTAKAKGLALMRVEY